MVDEKMVQKETSSFMKSLCWSLGSALLGNVCFFATFSTVDAGLLERTLLASALAAIANTPFEVTKKRRMVGDLDDLDMDILLRGMDANFLGGIVGTATEFGTYYGVVDVVPNGHSPLISGIIGVLAAILATVLAAPINTIKTIQMCDPIVNGLGMGDAAARILDAGGVPAFYTGLAPSIAKCVVPAFTMFTILPVLRTASIAILTNLPSDLLHLPV